MYDNDNAGSKFQKFPEKFVKIPEKHGFIPRAPANMETQENIKIIYYDISEKKLKFSEY